LETFSKAQPLYPWKIIYHETYHYSLAFQNGLLPIAFYFFNAEVIAGQAI